MNNAKTSGNAQQRLPSNYPNQNQNNFYRQRPPGQQFGGQSPAAAGAAHGGTPTRLDHSRKRPSHPGSPAPGAAHPNDARNKQQSSSITKKKKLSDKIVPEAVRDAFPDSQAYMDLLAFERKLDGTIMRKRLDIQEALKRPVKVKRKLRIYISNLYSPAKKDDTGNETTKACWELKVEGRLMEDAQAVSQNGGRHHGGDHQKHKRKFSSFFKSLVIELDKDLYGPDNHLVEWHRTTNTNETDGFQVKRDGNKNVKCTMLFMLNYLPQQYKLESRLARLLAIHTQTRPVIIQALWQYIKSHHLQDVHDREFIKCDEYLKQILGREKIKFSEIPILLKPLLLQPDPIVIHHVVSVDPADAKKQSCYDIMVDVDDTLTQQMSTFLLSSGSQQDIQELDKKIHDSVAQIKQHHIQREFFLGFSKSPQGFISDWIASQTEDLKTMTDAAAGQDKDERKAEYYYAPWTQEGVSRYFYSKVQQRRLELEQALKSSNM